MDNEKADFDYVPEKYRHLIPPVQLHRFVEQFRIEEPLLTFPGEDRYSDLARRLQDSLSANVTQINLSFKGIRDPHIVALSLSTWGDSLILFAFEIMRNYVDLQKRWLELERENTFTRQENAQLIEDTIDLRAENWHWRQEFERMEAVINELYKRIGELQQQMGMED